jgi:hypothetical protein
MEDSKIGRFSRLSIFDFQTNLEVFDQARIQQAKISFDFLAPILKSNSQ